MHLYIYMRTRPRAAPARAAAARRGLCVVVLVELVG